MYQDNTLISQRPITVCSGYYTWTGDRKNVVLLPITHPSIVTGMDWNRPLWYQRTSLTFR